MSQEWTIGIAFSLYLVAMLAIGVLAYLKTKDLSDYVLGGRSLGPWVTALSAGASDMSGWLLLGLPGMAYASGLGSLWLAAGLLLGTYGNWRVMARRLRAFSIKADNALTLPAYLERRFCDQSHLLRSLSAIFILIFFTIYTASGLIAAGKLFHQTFHLAYPLAVALSALAIISYTLFGGFLAVSWTDVVQGLLMSLALIVVPVYTIYACGGAGDVFTSLQGTKQVGLSSLLTNRQGQPLTLTAIISLLAWGLGYCGQPHILARFKAIRSERELPKARLIATTWTCFCLVGAILTGYAGLAYFSSSQPLADPETVFMSLVHTAFTPALAGILLAAVLAAVMSTADSQLLVASAALSEDIYCSRLRPQASQKEALQVGRLAVILIALAACGLALDADSLVLDVVAWAWAGFGATFGPVLIFSLYWKRMTRAAAIGGMLAGGLTVLFWHQQQGGLFDLYEIVPGMLAASLVIVACSLLWPRDHRSEEFFAQAQEQDFASCGQ